MKKLLALVIGIVLTCAATAQQIVPIVWAFSPASNQANALRVIIDNANKAQSKYVFIFENKPGAGGSIAVNNVINSKTPSMLMISTSIFTRPLYYPEQSYDINKLQPVAIAATSSPIAVISKDSTSIDDIKKKQLIRIGIVQGSITESVGRALKTSINNEVLLVPYASSINSTQDMLGGHIDASVEFIKDSLPWVEDNKAFIVGVTGSRQISNFRLLDNQKISGTEHLISNYYFVTSNNLDREIVSEFHNIITVAMLQSNVADIWKQDYAIISNRTLKETLQFWNKQKSYWELK